MNRFYLAIAVFSISLASQAAPIAYLTQDRSIGFEVSACRGEFPSDSALAEATDFADFDRQFRTLPEWSEICDDDLRVGQTSSLGVDSLSVDSHARSGMHSLDGGGDAESHFEITFELDQAGWFQLDGERSAIVEYLPDIVASEASVLLETIGGTEIVLDWTGSGSGGPYTLDELINLQAGTYRLTVRAQAYVSGTTFGDYGAYLQRNTQFSMVSAVPLPATVWLFGSALAGLGWLRRKQSV